MPVEHARPACPPAAPSERTASAALSSMPSSSLVNASAPPTDTMWPRSRGGRRRTPRRPGRSSTRPRRAPRSARCRRRERPGRRRRARRCCTRRARWTAATGRTPWAPRPGRAGTKDDRGSATTSVPPAQTHRSSSSVIACDVLSDSSTATVGRRSRRRVLDGDVGRRTRPAARPAPWSPPARPRRGRGGPPTIPARSRSGPPPARRRPDDHPDFSCLQRMERDER